MSVNPAITWGETVSQVHEKNSASNRYGEVSLNPAARHGRIHFPRHKPKVLKTQNPKPKTLNPEPQTQNLKPQTL